MDAVEIVSGLALKARTAARTLSTATGAERKAALYAIAAAIEVRSGEILKANAEDTARAKAEDMHPQMQDLALPEWQTVRVWLLISQIHLDKYYANRLCQMV
jgi:glutamate-5-semialdehyde dehydrogenase